MHSNQCSYDMDRGPLKQQGADLSDQSTLFANFEAQHLINNDECPLKRLGADRCDHSRLYADFEA